MEKKYLVIGIAGGTGSGKTTLMKNLIERFGDVVTVLSHDNYYRRHDDLTYEERCRINYDEPAALETDLMARHLDLLRQGQSIKCPVYDFAQHNRSDDTITVVPKSVIIVEGILIFENEPLRNLMDIKIFVDTDADVRLCRRIKRDVNKRGRTLECPDSVSGDGQTHARKVRRTQQAVCRYRGAGGRQESGGAGYDHGPYCAAFG